MKAKMLKIAGVKSEAAFYKKFPNQEAFMKVHGKEFKKAQLGANINLAQPAFKPLSYASQFDDADKMITGSTGAERQAALDKQTAAAPQGGGGGGFDIGGLMKMFGGEGGEGGAGMEGMGDIASSLGGARYGTAIPRAQYGGNFPPPIDSSFGGSPGYQQQQQNLQPIQSVNQLKPAGSTNPLATGNVNGKSAFDVSSLGTQGSAPQENGWTKTSKALGKMAGPVGDIIGGIGALQQEKEAAKAAKQTKLVSDVSLQAATSTDVDARRQMQDTFSKQRNAMMQPTTGENLFPVNGVGTNVLGRNGLRLQGGGEIQNTYAPDTLYDDLGYEPLNDSNTKQYYHGGRIHQMQDGGGTPWGAISSKATGMGQSLMGGQNAGGQIGGTAGKAIGSIFGPAGGAIGEFVGGIAGNALDPYAKRIKKDNAATQRNMQGMASANMAKGIQSQNQSFMEDGGWVSNDWQPQVIASFGGLDEQEVYDYAHEGMDTLRAGGHLRNYTPPSDRAMEIYEDGGEIQSYGLGGELQTHWGGGAETISRNPYLPGTGETVMFRGKSHEEYSPNGETGIGVTYGGNPVEVERGEPMVELEEGGVVDPETGEVQKSGVVFGNLKIPNQYIDMLGDKKAKGKKFKNYVADLSKIEEKQNTLIEKSTNQLNQLNPKNSFDKLKLTSLQASIQGANMKLKDLADKKINAASLQNAINDTAEEHGLVADDLARGKVKIDKEAMQTREARWGDAISKAADGKTVSTETTAPPKMTRAQALAAGYKPNAEGKLVKLKKAAVEPTEKTVVTPGKGGTGGTGGRAAIAPIKDKYRGAKMSNEDWKAFLKTKQGEAYKQKYITGTPELKAVGATAATPDTTEVIKTPGAPAEYEEIETEDLTDTEPKNPWWDTATTFANAILPNIRPSDAEELNAAQLYPEMFAMANNQVSPVQANFYRPELGVPYDISYQDQLNANQADYRAAQRTMGYNPAAQANLNAQKYQANQGILGSQFRANQEMKDRVYGENRNILNQAKLTNLGIADQQYQRQTEALSNTKATTQAALNSISDKYAKNKLENRELKTYENMYNYRFGPNFRARNMNPLAEFDTDYKGASSEELDAMSAYKKAKDKREAAAAKKDAKETDKKRNGSIVKSYKNI
jgi:hypothetical protein